MVLQCGADSLGGDRLGGFNISIAAHGECVRFMKAFRIPLLVLGGGGYTPRNVARCWTYETSVLVSDTCPAIPNTLPSTPYDSIFKDEPKLHVNLVTKADNSNSKKTLETLRVNVLERLRYMHGAPSVQMQQIPPGLADWLESEEDSLERDRERLIEARAAQSRSTATLLDYFPNPANRHGSAAPPQNHINDLPPAFRGMPTARTRASYALNSKEPGASRRTGGRGAAAPPVSIEPAGAAVGRGTSENNRDSMDVD